mmetsp:Transcript_12209/g.30736  ORF Transcript_12209/g.30736 Transcript_12209/m.30736 type:complete len:212 (-) Transcript_12209:398-1033(-)
MAAVCTSAVRSTYTCSSLAPASVASPVKRRPANSPQHETRSARTDTCASSSACGRKRHASATASASGSAPAPPASAAPSNSVGGAEEPSSASSSLRCAECTLAYSPLTVDSHRPSGWAAAELGSGCGAEACAAEGRAKCTAPANALALCACGSKLTHDGRLGGEEDGEAGCSGGALLPLKAARGWPASTMAISRNCAPRSDADAASPSCAS